MNDSQNLAIDSFISLQQARSKKLFRLKIMKVAGEEQSIINTHKKSIVSIENKIQWEIRKNEEVFRNQGLI